MTDRPDSRALLPRLVSALQDRALLRKAGSFAAVGVINASIDFAVFWTATHAFEWPMPDASRNIIANTLAWMVAVSASYVMNSQFTFAAESGRQLRWAAYFAFVVSGIAGWLANTTTLVVGDWLLSRLVKDADVALAIAKFAAIGASFVVNFSLSHFVVFRVRPKPLGDRD
jgi:putative flippase GtrA